MVFHICSVFFFIQQVVYEIVQYVLLSFLTALTVYSIKEIKKLFYACAVSHVKKEKQSGYLKNSLLIINDHYISH